MRFEFLPNEILIECFDYFNIFEIYHSFDNLNSRFKYLLENITLHLDFENVRKTTFDKFCQKILSNPSIKNQIISLKLSNKYISDQFDTFLSLLSLDEFPRLRTLTLIQMKESNSEKLRLMIPLIPQLESFHLIDSNVNISDIIPFSKLQTLRLPRLDFLPLVTDTISSIRNLTILYCSFDKLYQLFQYIPLLKYLNAQHVADCDQSKKIDLFSAKSSAVNLVELILIEEHSEFNDFEMFIQQTPNLKMLTISSTNNKKIDAYRWENLIRTSLPYLDIFKFKFHGFTYGNTKSIIDKLKQFQNDFWQKEHQWYTEYSLSEYLFDIYTIPYPLKTFELVSNINRYNSNSIINHSNTFNNVKDLILHHGTLKENCQYYFSKVESLKLQYAKTSEIIADKTNDFQMLKMIVNLSYLKHLDIFWNNITNLSSFLLNLFKQAPCLSSLSIKEDDLISFFGHKEICEYLNKMIKNLNLLESNNALGRKPDKIRKICQICSNIERLSYSIYHSNDLLLLLNNLPKLSTMKLYLSPATDYSHLNAWLKQQSTKLNIMFDTINDIYTLLNVIMIWRNKDM